MQTLLKFILTLKIFLFTIFPTYNYKKKYNHNNLPNKRSILTQMLVNYLPAAFFSKFEISKDYTYFFLSPKIIILQIIKLKYNFDCCPYVHQLRSVISYILAAPQHFFANTFLIPASKS